MRLGASTTIVCTLLVWGCATPPLPPALPEDVQPVAHDQFIPGEGLTAPVAGVIQPPPQVISLEPQLLPYPRPRPKPRSQRPREDPPQLRPTLFEPPPRRHDPPQLVRRREPVPTFVSPSRKALSTGLVTYTWGEGNTYLVVAAPDHPVTLTLPPGEKLGAKLSVDPEKWDTGYIQLSDMDPPAEAVQLRPTVAGYQASTQLITTSGRLYLLKLKSQEAVGMLSVKFELPEDVQATSEERPQTDSARLSLPPFPALNLRRVHTAYTIAVTKGTPPWIPQRVFDDGHLTILEFKASLQYTKSPAVYVRRANGEAGVVEWSSWEQRGNPDGRSYYVLGGLWPVLLLQAEGMEVQITRGPNRQTPPAGSAGDGTRS